MSSLWMVNLGASDGTRLDPSGRVTLCLLLSHRQFVGGFEWSSADAADDGRTIATGERIGDFALASGAVEKWLWLGHHVDCLLAIEYCLFVVLSRVGALIAFNIEGTKRGRTQRDDT